MERVDILGVGFDNLTFEQARDRAYDYIGGKCHYMVTPNPEIVYMARNDPEASAAVNGADMVIADAIGIMYGARILKTPLQARIPGIDLAVALMRRMAERGGRLFLLGAKPGVAEKARDNLSAQYPGLEVCGVHDGYFTDDALVINEINESGADVIFVCLGSPRQELWMRDNRDRFSASLMIGLGGSIDIFSGTVKRAPAFMRRLGLEWLYRLIKQPSRIGRMMKLPMFLVLVMRHRKKSRKARQG